MPMDDDVGRTLEELFGSGPDGKRKLGDEALRRCLSRADANGSDAKAVADDCYSILLEAAAPEERTGYQDAFRECTEVLREFGLLR